MSTIYPCSRKQHRKIDLMSDRKACRMSRSLFWKIIKSKAVLQNIYNALRTRLEQSENKQLKFNIYHLISSKSTKNHNYIIIFFFKCHKSSAFMLDSWT